MEGNGDDEVGGTMQANVFDDSNPQVEGCSREMSVSGTDMDEGFCDADEQDSLYTDSDLNDESSSSHPTNLAEDNVDNLNGDQVHVSLEVPVAAPEPYVGMEFEDEEEAYHYYNMYAKETGFSVRKGRVERSRSDKHVITRAFVCSSEGKKYSKDKRRVGKDYQPRATKKTNCGAAMRVKALYGKWTVDSLVVEHNHELVDPRQSYRLRSHQKANRSTVLLVERLTRCGITPSKIFTILKDFAGGEQHTGISDVRFRSLFRAKRRKSLGADCQLAINYLEGKRATDPNFYYSISVNEDQELTGIFWVDGRAREQYQIFGDVVVFDTTYRKNKYKFPFAPFTGVNHHLQCTLFGCGLIADETKESFEWIFRTWVKAMHNVHPKAILTDEDPGIMRAVKKVFPETVHRLCAWHLEKHRLTHMGPLYRKFPGLKQMFFKCWHKSSTPIEFETSWETMIRTYNLETHKWLKKKFKIRKHWVPCYFPDTFFAGMTTTQRAESMNNYFKGFFSSSTPISEFITQYEEAIRKRRGIESKADVNCITTSPVCSTCHPLEMHAAEVYTTNVFNIFKEQWKDCLGVEIRECISDPPYRRYETIFRAGVDHINVQFVVDSVEADATTCTCKMYEHAGVICKHIMKVFVLTDRRRIPECYILPRWTKAARFIADDSAKDGGPSTSQPQQPVWMLNDLARRLVTEGSLSVERYGVTYNGMTNLLNDVLKLDAFGPNINYDLGQHSNSSPAPTNDIRAIDPTNHSITRGRPLMSRQTGTTENFQHKRCYRCSGCGQTGHNVVKCPKVIMVNADNDAGTVTVPPQHMLIDLNAPPTLGEEY